MHASIPAVEITDDADAPRVGGPDREVDAVGGADAYRMGAELVVEPGVFSLAEQIEIEVSEDAPVAIRVVDERGVSVGVLRLQPVVGDLVHTVEHDFEHARPVPALHPCRLRFGPHDAHLLGPRQHRADAEPALDEMRTEDGKRIGVPRAGDRVDGAVGRSLH